MGVLSETRRHLSCFRRWTKVMKIKELKAEGLSHTYAVTIPKEDLETKLEAKIKEMQPQVTLKGFRPGKVPTSHIRKMFGQSIMKDVVEETVNETSQQAINDNKIRPAGQPQIDMRANGEEVTKGKADLEYQLTVESIPEFEPVEPDTLKFTRLTHEADDKELEEEIAKLGEGQKSYKKKAKTAKAKKGDAVLIDFVGTLKAAVSEQYNSQLELQSRMKSISRPRAASD